MEGISDIRIVAVDPKRPPVIRKEPYIDVYYELSHKAPKPWCERFNALTKKGKYTSRIQPDEGLYLETWVRTPDEVADGLLYLRQKVTECNNQHIAEIVARRGSDNADSEALRLQSGEQGRLNQIVAELDFGTAD